jgi:isomerase DpgB
MTLHRLANQLGVARARGLALFGGTLAAERALVVGVLDEISFDIAGSIAAVAKAARDAGEDLAVRRRLLLDAPGTTFEEALGAHLAACDRSLRRLHEPTGVTGDGH